MIAPETLLRMTPIEALRQQIQLMLKKPLLASHLLIGPPKDMGNLKTRVEVIIDRTSAPVELWDRIGVVTFDYNRISLPAFTAGLSLQVKVNLPTTSQEVLQGILGPYRVPVVEEDVLWSDYTTLGNASIIASPQSYRWVGEIQASLIQQGYDIAEVMKHRRFAPSYGANFKSDTLKDLLTYHMNVVNAMSLPHKITSSMYTTAAPEINGPNAEKDNTALKCTFTSGPYVGSVTIYYMRRNFDNTFVRPVKISGPALSNKRQLYRDLSVQIGCAVQQGDIVDEAFPNMAVGATTRFGVKVDYRSLAYVGDIMVDYTRTN